MTAYTGVLSSHVSGKQPQYKDICLIAIEYSGIFYAGTTFALYRNYAALKVGLELQVSPNPVKIPSSASRRALLTITKGNSCIVPDIPAFRRILYNP